MRRALFLSLVLLSIIGLQVQGVFGSGTPNFTIGANPPAPNVKPGSTITVTISLKSLNGFAGAVNLTKNDVVEIAATLNPTTVSLLSGKQATSTLTVSTPSNTTLIIYSIFVTGTSSSLSQTVRIEFTVK